MYLSTTAEKKQSNNIPHKNNNKKKYLSQIHTLTLTYSLARCHMNNGHTNKKIFQNKWDIKTKTKLNNSGGGDDDNDNNNNTPNKYDTLLFFNNTRFSFHFPYSIMLSSYYHIQGSDVSFTLARFITCVCMVFVVVVAIVVVVSAWSLPYEVLLLVIMNVA